MGRADRGERALGVANSLLRGRGLEEIPAFEVARSPGSAGRITALVCAVPAVGYWLTRKAWMPELTRLVWLAWIVVGFALTYGNYLSSWRKPSDQGAASKSATQALELSTPRACADP